MKKIIILIILILILPNLYAENRESTNYSEIEQAEMKNDLLINTIVPGYWQLKQGNTGEGVLYMSSLPLYGVACYFLIDYLFSFEDIPEPRTIGNKHYLLYSDEFQTHPDKWKLFLAIMAASGSSLLNSYSQYAAQEDYFSVTNSDYIKKYGSKLDFGEILLAPWQPENVFNFDVFPVYPLLALSQLDSSNIYDVANYFNRESVSFLGWEVPPLAGFSLALGSSILLANMSTLAEEITFRGHLLRENGIHLSSITFGGLHSMNMLNVNTSVEGVAMQTLFATLFGYYAAYQTEKNGYDFRRMIALHFWHNVTAMTINYLINPDENYFFSINVNISLN